MLFALLALPLALSPVQRTWLVDADPACPAADFTSIQQAVDAAASGDTIFVRALPEPQGYAGFDLAGKGVRLVGVPIDGVERARVSGQSVLRSIGPDQSVVLRGFLLRDTSSTEARLEIDQCDGRVWIEDCVLDNRAIEDPGFAWEAAGTLVVDESFQVALIDTEVFGLTRSSTSSLPATGLGSPGMRMRRASVAAYECRFVGGDAALCADSAGPPSPGYPGSPGATVGEFATLRTFGCELVGGAGGAGCGGVDETGFVPGPQGPGGDALLLDSNESFAELFDDLLQGGQGSSPGADGPGGVEANVAVLAGHVRSLRTQDAAVAEGDQLDVIYFGMPGDLVLLAFQFEQSHGPLTGLVGQQLISLPAPILELGAALPDGTLPLSFGVPAGLVPPGTSIGVGAQALGISTQGEAVLTSATWVELVDLATGVGGC